MDHSTALAQWQLAIGIIGTFLLLQSPRINAQTASVERSTFGIESGFLGVWVHNEVRLTDRLALRSEIGLDASFSWSSANGFTRYLFTPSLTLEPRWYYNIKKRFRKERPISGNSANFVSLFTNYHPGWFAISNSSNSTIVPDISFIPTWGIRRCVGRHFVYELGIGIGYRILLYKQLGYANNSDEAAFNLHLRLGYRF